MRVAARRGMWGAGLALLIAACSEPRPAAATDPTPALDPAAEVALLAVVEGHVTVRDAHGGETVARPEMPLTRADTVVTSPGALAVVLLANGYVLKLEEDQATPVRALAHLDDPPPRESVAELFERALGGEAFARLGGAGRIERIAGWNARRASGETPAPIAKPTREAPPQVELDEAPPSPRPLEAPAPDAEGAPVRGEAEEAGKRANAKAKTGASAPAEKKPASSHRRDRPPDTSSHDDSLGQGAPIPAPGGGPPAPEPADAPDLVDSWILETGPKEQVTRASLPAALRSERRALARCVAEALPGVARPELRLRVAAGVVREVALGGGQAAPACAGKLVGRALAGVGDGWMIVRVRR
jgi:hypothetical protein